MTDKITLTDLVNLQNETTAVNAINTNNRVIELGMDNTLSRDGTAPNQMQANLDMNGFRVLNVPAPTTGTDLVRFSDLTTAQTLNQGTMAVQNANAVNITGGTINGVALGSGVTGATATTGDVSTKLATTAFVAASIVTPPAPITVGGKVGTITLRGGNLPAQELTVSRYDAAQTLTAGEQTQLAANTGTVTVAAQTLTLPQQQQVRANLGGPTAEMYTQIETGAVSSPLIRRLNNTLFASEFGAVGDNVTNDYTALQAFLTACSTSGKEGRFDPGKNYYVSGNDLSIDPAIGVGNMLFYGNNCQLRTDPAQNRIGLKILLNHHATRDDQERKVIIDGLRIHQFEDANALAGIQVIGTTNVVLRDCTVTNGSDGAVTPYVNYTAFSFAPSNTLDPNSSSFWCRVEGCGVRGGATSCPNGIMVIGQCNALKIQSCTFSGVTAPIVLARANTGLNLNEATIANAVRIDKCDFEGCVKAISFIGTPGWSSSAGLIITDCRNESTASFLDLTGLTINHPSGAFPVLGFNYLVDGTLITNPNGLGTKQVSLV